MMQDSPDIISQLLAAQSNCDEFCRPTTFHPPKFTEELQHTGFQVEGYRYSDAISAEIAPLVAAVEKATGVQIHHLWRRDNGEIVGVRSNADPVGLARGSVRILNAMNIDVDVRAARATSLALLPKPGDRWLTKSEAVHRYGVTERTFERWCSDGIKRREHRYTVWEPYQTPDGANADIKVEVRSSMEYLDTSIDEVRARRAAKAGRSKFGAKDQVTRSVVKTA